MSETQPVDLTALAVVLRFKPVSQDYPRAVAVAYRGDLARALADGDDQVAARVAASRRRSGGDEAA